MFITKDGAFYRQFLPHYRSPGSIYHCRFSVDERYLLTEAWMFEFVENAILTDHKEECLIHAYVIMPNHAHVIVQPIPRINDPLAWCDISEFYPLERITGKMKGRSSRLINQRVGRSGTLWQGESFDRTIRNMRDLENAIDYLHHNPVRWKLVEFPEQYRWSSLYTIYSGNEKYRGWFELPYVKKQAP